MHGRRYFIEVVENFPQECRNVIESLREVYRFEALAKEQKLSDEQRLAFHQASSQPVMEELQTWMKDQLDGCRGVASKTSPRPILADSSGCAILPRFARPGLQAPRIAP